MKDLQHLIQQLKIIESSRGECNELQQKRDDLEEKLGALNQELHELLILQQEDNENEEVKSKQDLITSTKKQKQSIDTQLDDMGELSESQIEDLKDQIISTILSKHPNQQESVLHTQSEMKRLKDLEKECQTCKNVLNSLAVHLDQISEIRQQVKQRGIVITIFGPNPNAKISQHLFELKEKLEWALPKVESIAADTVGKDALREIYAEVIQFFSELKGLAGESLGYKKLDTVISKATTKMNAFDRFFTSLYNKCDADLAKYDEKLRNWIEKYA